MPPLKRPLPPELLARVRELRQNATDAEQLLWQVLRNRALTGFKFRRQHPCEGHILDFYCHEARLAIELDGSGHLDNNQARYDGERTEMLGESRVQVIRFWNSEVLQDTQKVLEVITDALNESKNPSHCEVLLKEEEQEAGVAKGQ